LNLRVRVLGEIAGVSESWEAWPFSELGFN
jgi:hypothetical protein